MIVTFEKSPGTKQALSLTLKGCVREKNIKNGRGGANAPLPAYSPLKIGQGTLDFNKFYHLVQVLVQWYYDEPIRLVPTGVGTDPRRSVPTRLSTRAGR